MPVSRSVSPHGWDRAIISHLEEEVTCLLAWKALTRDSGFDIISRHPLNLTLVLWMDKASCLIQNSRGQRWCHVVLKGSSSWSTTRKKKSSSLNSVRPQGVPRKRLFLGAAWATLHASKCSFWLHICYILKPGTHSNPARFLIAVS